MGVSPFWTHHAEPELPVVAGKLGRGKSHFDEVTLAPPPTRDRTADLEHLRQAIRPLLDFLATKAENRGSELWKRAWEAYVATGDGMDSLGTGSVIEPSETPAPS